MIIDVERETVRTQYVKKIYQHAWLQWQMLCFAQTENYQMLYLNGRSKPSRGASDNTLNPSFNAWINSLTDQNRVNEWVNFPSKAKHQYYRRHSIGWT